MAEKGLDSGFRDKAGRYWSTQRYADTVLKSTVNRTYNEVERMSDYDVTSSSQSTALDQLVRYVKDKY